MTLAQRHKLIHHSLLKLQSSPTKILLNNNNNDNYNNQRFQSLIYNNITTTTTTTKPDIFKTPTSPGQRRPIAGPRIHPG